MQVDLAAHAIDLRPDTGGQIDVAVTRGAFGVLRQNRQGGLQPVREIAGYETGLVHHRVTLVEQPVDVARERRDLGRIAPVQPLVGPRVKVGQVPADLVDRPPAAPHLCDPDDGARQADEPEQVRVTEDREECRRRLAIAQRDVPDDDRGAEEADHQERGANHEMRPKGERAHHEAGSSRQ
jgi:hypothetical protein